MTTPVLTITRGLPGAGKSFYAKELVAAKPETWVRVNRDDTRSMLYGQRVGLTHEQEQHVTSVVHTLAKTLLKRGLNVIADDTNLRPKYVRQWRKIAASAGAEFEVVEFPPVSLEQAIAHDARRTEHAVGEEVIRTLWGKFTRNGEFLPVPEEAEPDALRPYTGTPGKPTAVLVDIDGTLAKMAGRGPYDLHRVHEDEPVENIVRLVDALRRDYDVIFMSGREDSCREATEEWLYDHVNRDPVWEPLFMRAADDKRRDSIVKAELFDKHVRDHYDVRLVVDDRDQVVEMWRALGLTCLQVAPGDF